MGAICGGICNGNFSALVCNGRIRLLVSGRHSELQIRAWTGLLDLHHIIFCFWCMGSLVSAFPW